MPIVTLTVRQPAAPQFKTDLLHAVHHALVGCGIHEKDLFQRVLELAPEDFRFDPAYPDLQTERGDQFVLVEILWGTGRSVKVKKKLLADLMAGVQAKGVDPEQVMVCFQDVAWENWSAGGGRMLHA